MMTQHSVEIDPCLQDFEEHRPLLFSIAYRMLGTVTEAEDAVQETYVRFSSVRHDEIRSVRSFLTTIVTRICLDQLKSARATRETYVGPWLPEPLVSDPDWGPSAPADVVEDHESISMAFLVLLETLSPLERAVFLLREVFEYDYGEVARIVDRTEAACRQTFRRAKQHIVARRPRFESSREEQERLVRSFIRACEEGELSGLTQVLAEDVTLRTDGGGQRSAALNPIYGADRVARFLIAVIRKAVPLADQQARVVGVNGKAGIVVIHNGTVITALSFEAHAGRIREIDVVVNPDKLARLTRMYTNAPLLQRRPLAPVLAEDVVGEG
jgi:RNA polymerase sigma-70 factor, ECF subfamily